MPLAGAASLWYNILMKKQKKVLEYNVIFQAEDGGGFSVYVPDLPGCISEGETFEEAQKNIKEAIELYLESNDNDLLEVTPKEARKQFMTPVQVHV